MKLYRAESFVDKRGVLINATPMNPKIRNVMYITGKSGSVRGSHTHKKDTHYCMIITGIIRYRWTKPKQPDIYYEEILGPGDIVLSQVGEWHEFKFLTKGAFIAMATEPRTQKSYEKNTIRR